MASQALQDLLARYRERIEALTDGDRRLDAAWALETFAGAAECFERGAARGPVQYSIAGRSFAFESRAAARAAMDAARVDLDASLAEWGGTGRITFGGPVT